MFVVTVEFLIHQQHESEFRETVLKQARNSVTLEADCHRFDVSIDAKDGCRVFLYELYTDEAAYQAHRQTPHYHEFSTRVADWVAQKNIKTWHYIPLDSPAAQVAAKGIAYPVHCMQGVGRADVHSATGALLQGIFLPELISVI
jgi:autoinducer 2-degrading protein